MQPETFKRPRLLASSVYLLSSAMFSTSNALVNILDSIKMTPVVSSFPSEKCGYIIGTHDGTFHCDECLAIGMLKTLPEFAKSTIIRTRKMDLLNQCDIVVDVGSEYNAESNRLDHHQREFSRTFPSHSTRLSSAGLVFEKFGKSIISNLAPKLATYDFQISDEIVDVIHKRLYRQFVEHVDAIDNGVSIAENPRYHISTSLSSRVGMLNPGWNEDQSTDALNNRFSSAVMLTCSEFVSHLDGMINQWLPARDIIVTAIANRFSVHESGKIIRLEKACPWKDHLYQIENEVRVKFLTCVYQFLRFL